MKGKAITMDSYEIADASETWCNYPGFTAESCQCGATTNTFAGGPGYWCPNCNCFNVQSWSGIQIPFVNPDFGPTLQTIRNGGKIARRFALKARQFTVGQKVWADIYGYPFRYSDVRPGRIVRYDSCYSKSMCWYYVQFENGAPRHTLQEQICRRPRGMDWVRKAMLAEKLWYTDVCEIPPWELRQVLKDETEISRLCWLMVQEIRVGKKVVYQRPPDAQRNRQSAAEPDRN